LEMGVGLSNYFPGLVSNHDSSDLSLPSSMSHLCPALEIPWSTWLYSLSCKKTHKWSLLPKEELKTKNPPFLSLSLFCSASKQPFLQFLGASGVSCKWTCTILDSKIKPFGGLSLHEELCCKTLHFEQALNFHFFPSCPMWLANWNRFNICNAFML
jgi:hypothetical protein